MASLRFAAYTVLSDAHCGRFVGAHVYLFPYLEFGYRPTESFAESEAVTAYHTSSGDMSDVNNKVLIQLIVQPCSYMVMSCTERC